MSIKTRTIKIRCCDFCDVTEDDQERALTKCDICGKDFCDRDGNVYTSQYENTFGVFGIKQELALCKECVIKIARGEISVERK